VIDGGLLEEVDVFDQAIRKMIMLNSLAVAVLEKHKTEMAKMMLETDKQAGSDEGDPHQRGCRSLRTLITAKFQPDTESSV
jgi:hypothetical protein